MSSVQIRTKVEDVVRAQKGSTRHCVDANAVSRTFREDPTLPTLVEVRMEGDRVQFSVPVRNATDEWKAGQYVTRIPGREQCRQNFDESDDVAEFHPFSLSPQKMTHRPLYAHCGQTRTPEEQQAKQRQYDLDVKLGIRTPKKRTPAENAAHEARRRRSTANA